MKNVAEIEASDSKEIRNMLRSMNNQHWSIAEVLDEYDIPCELRKDYEQQIANCMVS